MPSLAHKAYAGAMTTAILLLSPLVAAFPAHAQTVTILYSFAGQFGEFPDASLLIDSNGDLYGTTYFGGVNGFGTAFELSPEGTERWTETVLHSFGSQSGDGQDSYAGLVMDAKGNLYGTTVAGGTHDDGTVFELSPPAAKGGNWTETVLYSFGSQSGDGFGPSATPAFDSAGNLFGTTAAHGAHSDGTVFELSPPSNVGGEWTETTIYAFGKNSGDGHSGGALTLNKKTSDLYGTTNFGGVKNEGTVFRLRPPAKEGDPWTESVLYSFGSQSGDGTKPEGPLVMDSKGNIYGATNQGGSFSEGTVFELSPSTTRTWNETVIYTFGTQAGDGEFPYAGLLEMKGNLYGTASNCPGACFGTAFRLSPPANGGGKWTETILHSFGMEQGDGQYPYAALITDKAGTLYGTTNSGGANNQGTVFKLTP